jgi:fluoride exporter
MRAGKCWSCADAMGAMLWRDIALISLGAAIGANLRYAVNRLAASLISAALPYGTLIVNVTGSFILGFFLAWTGERVLASVQWRLLIAVGFCGGYTTYSSYGFETVALIEQGHYGLATANFIANNVLGLAAVVAGMALARTL